MQCCLKMPGELFGSDKCKRKLAIHLKNTMKKFVVHFKNKKAASYEAFSFTLKENKYWFHKKEDKSDFVSFAIAQDVQGIDEQPEESEPLGISMA